MASWSVGQSGDPDETAVRSAEARNNAYEKFFGPVERVFEEKSGRIPRTEVRAYRRRGPDGVRTYTLVTSGMSDLEMRVPARVRAPRRVELIFYCSDAEPEYVETIRWLAHFPHAQKTWIGTGHTIPNGNPPAPFWGSSILDTMLLMPTIVQKDGTLPKELVLVGNGVEFLWVVPLTSAECQLKLAKGLDAILDLFQQNRHPFVFDPSRKS